jgi:hypothetical protein
MYSSAFSFCKILMVNYYICDGFPLLLVAHAHELIELLGSARGEHL